jgi:hypothetical protein
MSLKPDRSEFHAIAIGFGRRVKRRLSFMMMDEFTAATFSIGPVEASFFQRCMSIRSHMERSIHDSRYILQESALSDFVKSLLTRRGRRFRIDALSGDIDPLQTQRVRHDVGVSR